MNDCILGIRKVLSQVACPFSFNVVYLLLLVMMTMKLNSQHWSRASLFIGSLVQKKHV